MSRPDVPLDAVANEPGAFVGTNVVARASRRHGTHVLSSEHVLPRTSAAVTAEMPAANSVDAEIKALRRRLVSIQEEERARIAHELHDQLGQEMTALRMRLGALSLKVADDDAFCIDFARIELAADRVDQTIDYLTWQLRAPALDTLGFEAAVEALVLAWSERFGIPAAFSPPAGRPAIAPDAEGHLYRIIQEALHNITKHAEACRVLVQFTVAGNEAVLTIADDGCGFDVEQTHGGAHGRGLGITSMRERAALVDGRIELTSLPGVGTTIAVHVPLASSSQHSSAD